MKSFLFAAALTLAGTSAYAAPEKYMLDASHSQIVFTYDHIGFSTTYGMFSGFEGEIILCDSVYASKIHDHRLGKASWSLHVTRLFRRI